MKSKMIIWSLMGLVMLCLMGCGRHEAKAKVEKAEQKVVKARVITMRDRLQPLFRAAAAVAIVLTLSNAMNITMQQQQQSDDINYAEYKDTYNDPAVAYEKMENALELISEGFSHTHRADSMSTDSLYTELK